MNRKVKSMLIKNGIKQADFAKKLGYIRGIISEAINSEAQVEDICYCTCSHAAIPEGLYIVTASNRSLPIAAFACLHCAKIWLAKYLPWGNIAELKLDADLASDLLKATANIEIIHSSNNATATAALNEHDFKL